MKKLLVILAVLLTMLSTSLTAFAAQPTLNVKDKVYKAKVELAGGSGRASIDSPATVMVSGGKGTLHVVWSSPNYDYMIVDGEKFLPVNTEGNSEFDIPVMAQFDEPFTVIADTTAMSKPHEIEYTITLKKINGTLSTILLYTGLAFIVVAITSLILKRVKK
ncbi:MAG: hypothetical protein MJ110_00160 [Lachnospiraceae bacterium]|nr:hypothetical protein [Lachnospiraceae bacterium]